MASDVHTRRLNFMMSKTKSINSASCTLKDRLNRNSRDLNNLLYNQSPFQKNRNRQKTSGSESNSSSLTTPSSSLSSIGSEISISEPTTSSLQHSIPQDVRPKIKKQTVLSGYVSELIDKSENVNPSKSENSNNNISTNGVTDAFDKNEVKVSTLEPKANQQKSGIEKIKKIFERTNEVSRTRTLSFEKKPDFCSVKTENGGRHSLDNGYVNHIEISRDQNSDDNHVIQSDSAIEEESIASTLGRPTHPVKIRLNSLKNNRAPPQLKDGKLGTDVSGVWHESHSVVTENGQTESVLFHSATEKSLNASHEKITSCPSNEIDDSIERELEEITWTVAPVIGSRFPLKSRYSSQSLSSACRLRITPDLLIDDTVPESSSQAMSELEKMIAKKYQQKRAASPHHRKQLHIIRRPQSVPAKGRAFCTTAPLPCTSNNPVSTFTENRGSNATSNEPVYVNTGQIGTGDVLQKPPRPNTRRYVKRNSKLNPDIVVNNTNTKGFQVYKREGDISSSVGERTSRRDQIKNIQKLFEKKSPDPKSPTNAHNSESVKSSKHNKENTMASKPNLDSLKTVSSNESQYHGRLPFCETRDSNVQTSMSHLHTDVNVQMDEIFSRPVYLKTKNILKQKKGKYYPSMEDLSNLRESKIHGKFTSMPNIASTAKEFDSGGRHGLPNPKTGKLSFSVIDIGNIDKLDDILTKNYFGNTEFDQLRKSKSKKTGARSIEEMRKLFSSEPSLSFRQRPDNQFKASTHFSSATTEYHTSLITGIVNDDTLSDINPDIFDSDVAGSTDVGLFPGADKHHKNDEKSELNVSGSSHLTFVHSSSTVPEPLSESAVPKLSCERTEVDASEATETFTINASQVTAFKSTTSTNVDLSSLHEETTEYISSISSLSSGQKSFQSHGFDVPSKVVGKASSEKKNPQQDTSSDMNSKTSVLNTTFSVKDEMSSSSSISQMDTLSLDVKTETPKSEDILKATPLESPYMYVPRKIEKTESVSKIDGDESPLYAIVHKPPKQKSDKTPVKVPSASVGSFPFSPPYATVKDCVSDSSLMASPPYATIDDCLGEMKGKKILALPTAKNEVFESSNPSPYATINDNRCHDTEESSPAYTTLEECKKAEGSGQNILSSVTASPPYATLEDCGRPSPLNGKPPVVPRPAVPIYSSVAECRQRQAAPETQQETEFTHYASLDEVKSQQESNPTTTTTNRPDSQCSLPQSSSQFSLYQSIDQVRENVSELANHRKTDSGIQMEGQSMTSADPNESNASAGADTSKDNEDLYAKVGHSRKKSSGVDVTSMTRSSSDEAEAMIFSDDELNGPPLPARRYKKESALKSSKGVSSSKSSLLNKMGLIKNSTKSKLKSIRKAVSLERGLDDVESVETPSKTEKLEKSKSKMRKAPSLKSLTALFGKKSKSKKDKPDQVLSVFDDNSDRLPAKSSTLSLSKKKLWSSAKSLEIDSVEAPTKMRTIGKFLESHSDGSQIIELTKPREGPIGFYIGRGTANYDYGIFVSRFCDESVEKLFAGLMNVGDEVLEINQRPVRDLSLDDVYDLMAARDKLVLKVFPMSSRRDL